MSRRVSTEQQKQDEQFHNGLNTTMTDYNQALDDASFIAAGIRGAGGYVEPRPDNALYDYVDWRDPQVGTPRPAGSPLPITDPTGPFGRYYVAQNAPTIYHAMSDAAANATPAAQPTLQDLINRNAPPPMAPPARHPMQPSIDQMRPKLNWIDPSFVPQQPPSSILFPMIPTADNVSDWLTGPPGTPQATSDPAYVRRFEGTVPYPSVRYATPAEQRQNLLNNAPVLARILNKLDSWFQPDN